MNAVWPKGLVARKGANGEITVEFEDAQPREVTVCRRVGRELVVTHEFVLDDRAIRRQRFRVEEE